ncbi:hypothetical protein L0V05_12415 [Tabrizicola sp. J26]|uniref:hypothetical protein n=1 Tax=Alitabrizicola rongguiensis TaxID=2909234 RepID=UPI001F2B1961|nr:hypothetical protein [Tabrizicola rongguiensis]MCF1709617.1 hypothetical protein [Tabrizicola rongguiensis]
MSSPIPEALAGTGWARLPYDPAVLGWVQAALPLARKAIEDPSGEWRCRGTWFPGVDALANDETGAVAGKPLPPSLRRALPMAVETWHRAQLSVLRPGYPRPSPEESEAAFRFRRDRDAAHVDGLLAVGPRKRRMIREPHGFILGLPLTDADPDAAPLVVWEGSHEVLRRAFAGALAPHSQAEWPGVDLTDIYQAARREVFATCRRVVLSARPGEALLLHRLVLHGMAPWADGSVADPIGRVNAYFRPELPTVADWLSQP